MIDNWLMASSRKEPGILPPHDRATGFRGKKIPSLRISRVRIHRLTAPLSEPFGWSLGWTDKREATLVEVNTDEGLTGWGDGFFGEEILRQSPETVVGRSPFEVEAIYDELRSTPRNQARTGAQICGGLDTALWDIVGQALEVPVCYLLGRRYRDRIQPYCTALYRKSWPDLASGLAEEAESWKDRGFRILKMKVGYDIETDVRNVRAVREAVGNSIGLAIDANCAYDERTAAALARCLEPLNISWFEEPVLADNLTGYARLRSSTSIALAGGETLSLDELVRDYVQPRLVDILQPEVSIIGLSGARRLSYLSWLNHMRMMPHNWGTSVRTAAILHWMSTVPPVTEAVNPPPILFELDCTENPFRDAVVRHRIEPGADGLIPVPAGPGLGVEVVSDVVREFRSELIDVV
jgi:D-galactarolactone cycloisomerase